MSERMVIEVQDLHKTYWMGETEVNALRGVSFQINEGEMVAITGPSGSGKSTLMAILGALDLPTRGSYSLDSYDIGSLRDNDLALIRNWRIGFVFQQFNLLPRSTALANVALPLVYAGLPGKERTERAKQMLALVGLGDRLHHKPTELSGGQQQRVALARALVNEPAIVLADEPTGNLDSKTGDEIMSLFWQLHEEQGITLVIVTHDPEIAEQTERVITLLDGLIVADERNGHNVVHRRHGHVSELSESLAEPAVESGADETAQSDSPQDPPPADHQHAVALLAQASAEEVARRMADEAPANGTETQTTEEEAHEPED